MLQGDVAIKNCLSVLFVVPPEKHFIESYVTKKLDKGREIRQKLGIMYVASALRENTGIVPEIIDCLADGYNWDDLKKLIQEKKPDLIGFSVLTFNLLNCLEAAEIVRHVSPQTKICFGGFHVSIYPSETLNLPNVDFVVFGEGETTFSELVKAFVQLKKGDEGSSFKGIDGLGYNSELGEACLNNPRKPIPQLDDLPFPAHDLIDIEKYTFVLSDESKVGAIQTSRGCPSKCVFCDIRLTKYRYRSEENVLEEIKMLRDMGIKDIFMIDDTFTINRNRVVRLCKLLIQAKLGIKYKISSRIDKIDEEMLDLLAKSGCYRIHYGIESGSQRILDYLQKEITVEQIIKVVEMTKKAKIEVFAYMMLGIPTETLNDMEQSFNLVKKLMPDHVNYSICTPFPKTYLYESALKNGKKDEDYWHDFAVKPAPTFKIRTFNEIFNYNELRSLQDKALREFYSSPKVIFRELIRVKSFKQLLVKVKMGIKLLMPR